MTSRTSKLQSAHRLFHTVPRDLTAGLRVLHLIPSISPLRGGPSQAVLAMTAALRNRGVDARILTTNDHGPGLLDQLPLGCWHERDGVPVLAFQRWSPPLPALREFAVSPGLSLWLWRHLRSFDLLHVHALFSFPSTSGMAIARQRRLPYLLRSIGQLNRWSLSQSRGRKQLLLNLVERRNLNRAARLHFTSEAERLEAADLQLRPQPLVLPLGVSLPALAPFPRDDQPIRFLFLSRLHPKKQLESLLQALALVQARQPQRDWTLQIAGDGDPGYVASLQRLAGSLGLGSRCQWLGFQSGASKQKLLAQAHWFVLPSASENFGIAAAEALAAGTPLIVSPGVALAPAVLQAGAGVVVDPVPECLAVELEAALTPPPQTMRNAARKLAAETYSWPAIAAELEAEYVRILEGR